MNKYELLLILPGTLDENEAQTSSESLVDLIKQHAEEVEVTVLGKNRLAYPIKQIRYGYLYTITFTAEPSKTLVLKEKFRLHRGVLRFMISHFSIALSQEQKIAYAQGGAAQAAHVVEREIEKEAVSTGVEKEEKKKATVVEKEEKKVDMDEVKKKLDKILDETDVIAGV